ncbi:MAG: hypothetical protein M1816_006250 [Peltula sp. TS41687]|nr:MAG: hypothetical protein M1816_006250 [Peltula sp. TS41687]
MHLPCLPPRPHPTKLLLYILTINISISTTTCFPIPIPAQAQAQPNTPPSQTPTDPNSNPNRADDYRPSIPKLVYMIGGAGLSKLLSHHPDEHGPPPRPNARELPPASVEGLWYPPEIRMMNTGPATTTTLKWGPGSSGGGVGARSWVEEVTFRRLRLGEEAEDADGWCVNRCMARTMSSGIGEVNLGKLYDACRAPGECNVGDDSRWKSYADMWTDELRARIKGYEALQEEKKKKRREENGGEGPRRGWEQQQEQQQQQKQKQKHSEDETHPYLSVGGAVRGIKEGLIEKIGVPVGAALQKAKSSSTPWFAVGGAGGGAGPLPIGVGP